MLLPSPRQTLKLLQLAPLLAVPNAVASNLKGATPELLEEALDEENRRLPGAVKSCAGDCVIMTKDGDLKQQWCSRGDGTYYHENFQKSPSDINEISISAYLDQAIQAGCIDVLASGTADAVLYNRFFVPCGTTTWRFGYGNGPTCSSDANFGTFTAEWLVLDTIGLMITFTLNEQNGDGVAQSGVVRTVIGGQNAFYDWGGDTGACCTVCSGGHVQIRSHEIIEPIQGVDCNDLPFEFSWDHKLDSSGGDIRVQSDTCCGGAGPRLDTTYPGWTKISIGDGLTNSEAGFAATNCGDSTTAVGAKGITWLLDVGDPSPIIEAAYAAAADANKCDTDPGCAGVCPPTLIP